MAHTDVTLTNDSGVLVPSLPSVPVTSGDTIAFSTSNGAAFLFFSPDATAALSPAPTGPIEVGASKPTTFTFTSSEPGAYSVFFEASVASAPSSFPVRQSNQLTLEIDDSGTNFGGPSAGTKD
jgi:plastocyanin